MQKILITGGTGFIGRHLVRRLLAAGMSVRCYVRASSPRELLAGLPVEFVQGDLTDPQELRRAVAGCDTVFHLAGMTTTVDPQKLHSTNVTATYHLAEACAWQEAPPVLVYVSSLAAAGTSPQRQWRQGAEPPRPVSAYGRSKRGGEVAVARWYREAPITTVRPAIVFGEENRETFPIFETVLRWRLHFVPTWSDRQVALVHQADLIDVLLAAAERGERGARGIYFAADECCPTYAAWGRMIARSAGVRTPLVLRIPESALWMAAAANQWRMQYLGPIDHFLVDKIREATAGHWVCDGRVTRDQLQLPAPPSLSERLRQTVDWYYRAAWVPSRTSVSRSRQPAPGTRSANVGAPPTEAVGSWGT